LSQSLPQTLAQTFGKVEISLEEAKACANVCLKLFGKRWRHTPTPWRKKLAPTFASSFLANVGATHQHPGGEKLAPTFASSFLANVGATHAYKVINVWLKV